MRYILLVLLAFVTTFASAQVQFLGSPTTTVRNRGNFVSDSLFYLPKRQVAPTDTAAMRYAISDSSVYVWTGGAWRSIGRAGASFLSLSDTASMLTPYTRGSGTTNYLPKFTGSRTFGNSQIFDNGTRIGINTTAPVAPFQIGNANYYPSDDPVLLLSRNVNNDGGMSGTNAHSISEASIITRSGNIAFAGIENRAKFSGTNSFDHYAGFQNGLKYSSTGTITNYFGYYDALSVDSGTVTNAYGIYLQDATKAASATLTNNYGIYIGDRTAGTNDWTIYSNSTANSYFKGQINTSKIITNEGNTAANATAEIEIQTNSGSKADLRLYQLGNNYWDIQIPANQTYLSIGDISGTYMYLKNGGEVNIGSVTDAGAYALQVAGSIYNTTGAVLAATSGAVGIGVTPQTWAFVRGLEIGRKGNALVGHTSVNQTSVTSNAYFNDVSTTSWKYGFSSEAAARYTQESGIHQFFTAGTGTADAAISFQERMRITNDGELLINTTTDAGAYALQVAGAIYNTTGGALAVSSGGIGIGTTSIPGSQKLRIAGGDVGLEGQYLYMINASAQILLGASQESQIVNSDAGSSMTFSRLGASAYMAFNVAGAERMRINNAGEILVGGADAGAFALQVTGAIYNTTTITSGAPTGGLSKPWRLGEVNTVSPTSPNRTIRVEIDGTVYYLHAKTTND